MAEKNKDSINENIKRWEDYFKDDLAAIDEEMTKSKGYSKILDDAITKLTGPSLGASKGGQHYVNELLTIAAQMQTQRQGLRRDKTAIKKSILDYSMKFADTEQNTGSAEDYMAEINKLMKNLNMRNNIENEELEITELSSEEENDIISKRLSQQ